MTEPSPSVWRRRRIASLACTLIVLTFPAARGAGGAPGEPSEIDLTAGYFRYHLTFAPARIDRNVLARDLAADDGGMARWMKRKRIDLSKPFVGHPFFYRFHYSGHGGSSDLTYLIRSSPPPGVWMRPRFDDSAWPRQRLPMLVGRGGRAVGLAVVTARFRTRFIVDEAARSPRVRLTLAFRGGAVVYLNGKEIARAHVAGGEGDDGPTGEPYPLEAYTQGPTDVGPAGNRQRPVPELSATFPRPNPYVLGHVKANPKAYKLPLDQITTYYRQGSGHSLLTRAEWEKINALRDRRLGPVALPAGLLRKGVNVLAVEIRRSDLHPVVFGGKRLGAMRWDYFGGYTWMHGALLGLALETDGGGVIPPQSRPPGIQLWTQDIHRRVFATEFGPIGGRTAPLRIAGTRNGTFSAQAVVGTRGPLAQITATAGALSREDGKGAIPASAVTIRYGRGWPAAELAALGSDRSAPRGRNPMRSAAVSLALARHAPGTAPQQRKAAMEALRFFDHLTAVPPASVPADSCLPVWVTVRIPADAKPGTYRGELTVRAGEKTVTVPIHLDVIDWRLPDPDRFETVMALEQSPYGVARHYKVPLWSAEHFRLMEPSFRRLAEVGNDYLVIPVLVGSEFGNGDDAMVRWRKQADGTYACDFTIFEKYLDLATRYGTPRCVCFVLCHATDNNLFVKPRVVLLDAAGKPSLLDVPPPAGAEARALWTPFVDGLKKRMAARGLTDAIHWGFLWDTLDHGGTGGYVAGMIALLKDLAPEAAWARGAHRADKGVRGENPFRFVSSIYSLPYPVFRDPRTRRVSVASHKGWKNPAMHLVLPRVVNTVVTVEGASSCFSYRLAPMRAMIAGGRGLARIGADYWAQTYHAGWRGGVQVGMSVTAVLWPGSSGAEGGARFECLREGVQEAEARIFLERKLETAWANTPGGRAAKQMLDRHIRETLFVPPGYSAPRIAEYCGGWQRRSRELYEAAAEAD